AARPLVTPRIQPVPSVETGAPREAGRRTDAESFAIKPNTPALQPVFPPPIRAGRIRTRPQPTAVKETHTPPTIQVTIGRIEGRGPPPPAPSRASRAAAPKLNLEDYLRDREGKAR